MRHTHAVSEVLAQAPPVSPNPPVPANTNPFEGVTPNFTIFGETFTSAWQQLLAGAWGLAFVIVAFNGIRAAIELQHAKRGGYQASVYESAESLKRWGLALAALTGLPIIFGAVVSLFS